MQSPRAPSAWLGPLLALFVFGVMVRAGAAQCSNAWLLAIPVTMPSLSPLVVVSQGVAFGPLTGFAITNPSFTTLP